MTDKARNVLNLIETYKIFYDFTANDISQVASEKVYPATLTSMVKEGILKKVGEKPCLYRYIKEDDVQELSNFIWELFEEKDGKIVQSNNFDIPIEIASNGLMKFKTKQTITVGTKIDFFDARIDDDTDRYQAWNIMNYREDLKFVIFTFNKEYEKLLPDNWQNGYKNVEIRVLKSLEDIKVCSQKEYLSMTAEEQNSLWNYCINLLKEWQGEDFVLNHSESFLVGYLYLFLNLTKLDKDTQEIENALLSRYSKEETDRFIVLGKDISKRGIPIYKELE